MEVRLEPLEFCNIVDDMLASVSSARESIQTATTSFVNMDFKDGISLLSLKHHLLLAYLNSIVLVSSRRAIGHSIDSRSSPNEPFSTVDRPPREGAAGDAVDSMIEGRIVLEKIHPLAFRPNPSNFTTNEDPVDNVPHSDSPQRVVTNSQDPIPKDIFYRPPRVAPVPYLEKSKSKSRGPPIPSALLSLSSDPSRPYTETTSGLGSTPSLASGRAAYLRRLNEFEEENFSRVVMKKSDARRRARDEEDLALGGSLSGVSGKRRRGAGGLDDEFGDVLRTIDRADRKSSVGGKGDGYDELRERAKKADYLHRSRHESARKRGNNEDEVGTAPRSKRSRFELEAKNLKTKLNKRRK